MPGPPPTPTNVLAMRGSWRAKKRSEEPRPDVKAPTAPSWIGREAKREWTRVAHLMEELGIVTELDRGILTSYCLIFQQLWEIRREMKTATKGISSLRKQERDAAKELRMQTAHLGLSPTARTKVKVEKPKGKSELEELLDGGKK